MQKEKPKYPKRPRIGYFSYEGHYSYFITICTNSKREVFVSSEAVNLVLDYLKMAASQCNFQVYTYCFMPDHLHLLIVADNEKSDLKEFLRIFKQKSSYCLSVKQKVYRTNRTKKDGGTEHEKRDNPYGIAKCLRAKGTFRG